MQRAPNWCQRVEPLSLQFNGEPHSYTRFNLTQNMEGDNSHVELKLSSDADEEAGGNGVGDHLNHNRNKPYVAQKPGRHTRTLVILGLVALAFCLGEDSRLQRLRDTLHAGSV